MPTFIVTAHYQDVYEAEGDDSVTVREEVIERYRIRPDALVEIRRK